MQGQPARKELTPAQIQRAQDKESKRARGALSCAECRRLKLKCDKTVPCSSCKRRGCSAICPNGSLTTGQGTRFVLADTEKLHQKIAAMSDRIRQLEDALAILQSTQTRDPHPLLSRDLLKIKSILELHAAGETGDDASGHQREEEDVEESQTIDAFGTLAIRDDGAATFYGRSAGQESLLIGEVSVSPSPSISASETQAWTPNAALPPNVKVLASSFPFSTTPPTSTSSILVPPPHDIDFDTLSRTYLPSWDETQRLCSLYLEQAPWFFGAVARRQLEEEILPTWYDEAPRPPESQPPLSPGTPHDLALLFIVLTFGALTDSAALAAASAVADAYYTLTKAALGLAPVLERPPSVATVQTLSLMAIYEGMNGGENSIEATWALMGLATKLAQSIGLHRDCARWNLSPAEVQKRRALFWELFITDCWQSLATGRLATFSLPFVDCELPFDPDQTMTNDGVIQPSFPFWKARFGAECVAGVVQGTLTSRAPKYSIILNLDRKVRDMELPAYSQGPPPQGAGLAQTMSHFMPINYRELTLLYIHRCFFAHAIASRPTDPIRSQYAPSFLAGYRSACTIIGSVRQQFSLFPAQIARFWVLWTHAFSAAVMLASVVTHSSQSRVAPAALIELRNACELFEQASAYGGRSSRFLPILRRLQNKAYTVFMETNNGNPPSAPGDIFRPTPAGGEHKDELSIFSGKTHTLTTKAAPRTHPTTATTSSSSGSPQSTSNSPGSTSQPFVPVDNPAFANVHPSLVMELRGFDGHIAAQIKEAYGTNGGIVPATVPPQQGYSPRHQMEVEHRERAERNEIERRQLERRKMELERRQLEIEQQRLYREQQEEEERQRQEQEEHYRQQQAMHEREIQHQLELDRQRQPRQYQLQSHVQQPHQVSSAHYQQDYHNDHHYDQACAGLSTQHLAELDSTYSHSHNHVQSIYTQAESPTRPQPQTAQEHSMYVIPPEYRKAPHQQPVPSQLSVASSHSNGHDQPYANHSSTLIHKPQQASDHRSAEAIQHVASHQMEYEQEYASHTQLQGRPQQQQTQSVNQETYQYWTTPDAPYSSLDQVVQVHGVYSNLQQQDQHYTPGGALKGIAADDISLQETWQSYMYKVGSPRQFLED